MRILLDESLPRDLAKLIVGHEIVTVAAAGWWLTSRRRGLATSYGLRDFGRITPLPRAWIDHRDNPALCIDPFMDCRSTGVVTETGSVDATQPKRAYLSGHPAGNVVPQRIRLRVDFGKSEFHQVEHIDDPVELAVFRDRDILDLLLIHQSQHRFD